MYARTMQAPALSTLIFSAVSLAIAQPIRQPDGVISSKPPPRHSVRVAVNGFWPQVAFLDDGRILVGGDQQNQYEIRVAKTGTLVKTFPEKQDKLLLGRFRLSADRKWLATMSWPKGIVTVWEVATGKVRGTVASQTGTLLDLTPDGRTIALFSELDCAVVEKLAVLATQLIAARSAGGGVNLGAAIPAVNGLEAERTKNLVEIWDVVTNRRLRTSPFTLPCVDVAAFSPDGTWLVVSGRNDLAYWKWQQGGYQRLHVGRRICALAFSPDGRLLAEGPDSRKTMEIRELASLKVVRAVKDEISLWLYTGGLAFGRDGRTLITGNAVTLVESIKVPHRIHVWDVQNGKLKRQIALDWGIPVALDVSPDGNSLAVLIQAGNQTRLAVWDLTRE